ncbi:uncharacterized protein LOC110186835 [Drosophila serrata]|uniref:uncharacterized protein LOC110186835 n=1 Tax=Drosophila serrata TaxID=7274 RepID=UPI000A1D34CF|nr:uncharacterized protein LOC110186835 [Drosophila serrata]
MSPMKNNIFTKSHGFVPELSQHEIDKIIKDVIAKVHQDFIDDGAGEEALQRLLHTWYSKMMTRRSPLDLAPEIPPSNDKDNNSAAGSSSSSAVSFPPKQEETRSLFASLTLRPRKIS